MLGRTTDIQGVLRKKMLEVGIDPDTGERVAPPPAVKEAAEKEAAEEAPEDTSEDIIAQSREIEALLRKAAEVSPEAHAAEGDKEEEDKTPPEKTDQADPVPVAEPEESAGEPPKSEPVKEPEESKADPPKQDPVREPEEGPVKAADEEKDEEENVEKVAEALVTYEAVRQALEGGDLIKWAAPGAQGAGLFRKMRTHLANHVKPYIAGAGGLAAGGGAGVAAGKKLEAQKDPVQKRQAFRSGAVWMHNQYRRALQNAYGSRKAAEIHEKLKEAQPPGGATP